MFDVDVSVNAVVVKFIKKRRRKQILYPKRYTFKIHYLQAKDVKAGQTLYVKNRKGEKVPVIVQDLLELAPRECREYKAILTNPEDIEEVKI
ncbi:hypothetical protein AB9M75_11810 [Lactobacillus sp. AN1001]